MEDIKCSKCRKSLRFIGNGFGPGAIVTGADRSMFDQWFGNVCLNCNSVFCANCIKVGGPTPCPKCGQPTMPAQRVELEKIGMV